MGYVPNVSGEINPREIRRLIKPLMDQSHCFHSALTVFENLCSLAVADLRALQVEKTRDHLKIVFDSMMNFLEKDLFFLKRTVDALFVVAAICNVVILPQMIVVIALHQ